MGYSSVAVFGFNRPGHLERCLTSLELNPEASKTNVHIYIDGPRRTTDLDAVTKSRHVANKKYRFLNTIVHFKETNSGLAKSVIEGLTEVLRENPRVIVLEDDLIVAENFLEFMNRGLENYEHNQDVASIQGFVYKMSSSIADSFFLRGADCWGWATWADRWFSCEWNASTLIKEISEKNLGDKFNLDGSYSFMKILKDQKKGRVDSWAIRWHASMFLQNRLSFYPASSLVSNVGGDGSGTHMGSNEDFNVKIEPQEFSEFPKEIKESIEVRDLLKEFYQSLKQRDALFDRALYQTRTFLHNVITYWLKLLR